MISNAISNSNGTQKVPGGEAPSNPELINNGNFEDGQEGWLVGPKVTFSEGQATLGPPDKPPYAVIGQAILEDEVSYDVIIDVVAVPEEGRADVLDGRNASVFTITSTGQNSFSFTNSTGSIFSITSTGEFLTVSNVSVKKQ